MKRCIVEEGSSTGHCCFSYSVMDMQNIEFVSSCGKHTYYACVCECYEKEDAENICNLLNKAVDSVGDP